LRGQSERKAWNEQPPQLHFNERTSPYARTGESYI